MLFPRNGFLVLCLAGLIAGCASRPAGISTGPWDVPSLDRPPTRTWGSRTGLVQELHYVGEPLGGKPTRIFAYLGRPESSESAAGRFPGMVLVHGGGGKAFREWAEHWAQRGYVALAMDLAGNGPNGRQPDGGPDQADQVKFRNYGEGEAREMWSYHAVSAVILGHSLLRSMPEVDPDRTGITGISWGGYLTCIVAGLDHRFKVAVPVYGCGFLGDDSFWTDKSLAAMNPDSRARWLRDFDPSQYLGNVGCPILFLNGTTDFAYPPDSYQKSYRLVPEHWRHVSMNIDLPHGHIWTFPEVDTFVDSVLQKGRPVVRIGPARIEHGVATAMVSASVHLTEASLCYTTDLGSWQKRAWKTTPARIEHGHVVAEIPATRPLAGFLWTRDERGVRISGEHFELQ